MGYGWSGTKARNDEYPRSYQDALRYLMGGKDPSVRKLPGTATEVRRVEVYGYQDGSYGQIDTAYAVRYHDTNVITWYADGSFKLCTNGYETPTTAIKMNACLPNGYRVASVKSRLVVWGPSLGEGQDRKADGFKAHPTAEQWADDAKYWQERREAIAAREAEWKAESVRRHAEYLANADKPHTAAIYSFDKPGAEPVAVSEVFATRRAAEQWAEARIGEMRKASGQEWYSPWYIRTELAVAAVAS